MEQSLDISRQVLSNLTERTKQGTVIWKSSNSLMRDGWETTDNLFRLSSVNSMGSLSAWNAAGGKHLISYALYYKDLVVIRYEASDTFLVDSNNPMKPLLEAIKVIEDRERAELKEAAQRQQLEKLQELVGWLANEQKEN